MSGSWSIDKKLSISQFIATGLLMTVFFSWITAIDRKTDLNTRDMEHLGSKLSESSKRFERIESKLDRLLELIPR